MPDNRSTPLNIRKKDKATLSNVLNEMIYEKKMSLQEFRLFLLYLAKIDPQNPNQTEITFSLQQYSALLGVELNESALFAVMDKLLKRLVSIRPEVMPDYAIDGRIRCQLFSKCFMFKAKSDGKWYMSFKFMMISNHTFLISRGILRSSSSGMLLTCILFTKSDYICS